MKVSPRCSLVFPSFNYAVLSVQALATDFSLVKFTEPLLFPIESLYVSVATPTSKALGYGVDNREQLSIGKY